MFRKKKKVKIKQPHCPDPGLGMFLVKVIRAMELGTVRAGGSGVVIQGAGHGPLGSCSAERAGHLRALEGTKLRAVGLLICSRIASPAGFSEV